MLILKGQGYYKWFQKSYNLDYKQNNFLETGKITLYVIGRVYNDFKRTFSNGTDLADEIFNRLVHSDDLGGGKVLKRKFFFHYANYF